MRLTLMEGMTYEWQMDQNYFRNTFTYSGLSLRVLVYGPSFQRGFKLVV